MDSLKSKCRQEEERDHGVDCLLSHVLLGDIDGRKRRFHIGTKRHVVKADDAYIFGDADASFFDSLHSTCGDQVIVGKVTAGKLLKGLEILIFHFCCQNGVWDLCAKEGGSRARKKAFKLERGCRKCDKG